jgi:hypothetical protein
MLIQGTHETLAYIIKKDMAKKGIGQTKNPRTGKYVKIDRGKGKILKTKKSPGPYKNIPVIRKKKD